MSKQSTRVVKEIDASERWQSQIDGVIYVRKFDRNGKEIEEAVKGHGHIRLLPEERQLNQEMAAEPGLDPFLNGHLVPVELVESADDYEDLKGNPNHLSEKDMRAALEGRDEGKVQKAIAEVTNPATLQRFLAIANEDDSDATLKQVRTIQDRLTAVATPVNPEDQYIEIEQFEGRDVPRTSAPPSPAPPNPGMGRR